MQRRLKLFTGLAAGVGLMVAGAAFAQTTSPGPSSGTPGTKSGPTSPAPAPSPVPNVGAPAKSGTPPIGSTATPSRPSVGQPSAAQPTPGTTTPGTTMPGTSIPGTTPGAPATSSMPSATPGHGAQEQVRSLQQALQGKGMDPGPIDGVMGPKTQHAVREFQKKENLPQTGQMDTQTLQKLGVSKM